MVLEVQESSNPTRMSVVYLRAADKLRREKPFSIFFSGLGAAGCRIVDVKDEAKPAYEYSFDH